MTPAQYVVLCTACLGLIGAVAAAILPHFFVNKNQEVYLLKKQAILDSLNFLDDRMELYLGRTDDSIVTKSSEENLTRHATV